MSETAEYELTKKEESDHLRLYKRAEAVDRFLSKARGGVDDSLFASITCELTEALVEHSKILGRLTCALLILSLVLAGLTGVLIWRTF